MTCSFLSFKLGLKWHMLRGGLSWPNRLELPSTYPMLHHQVWFSLWNSSNIFLFVDYPSPWEQEPCLSCLPLHSQWLEQHLASSQNSKVKLQEGRECVYLALAGPQWRYCRCSKSISWMRFLRKIPHPRWWVTSMKDILCAPHPRRLINKRGQNILLIIDSKRIMTEQNQIGLYFLLLISSPSPPKCVSLRIVVFSRKDQRFYPQITPSNMYKSALCLRVNIYE